MISLLILFSSLLFHTLASYLSSSLSSPSVHSSPLLSCQLFPSPPLSTPSPLLTLLFSQSLTQVDRRWAWFRRLLRTVDSKFSTVCPPHWRLPLRLCLEFTDRTKVLLWCAMYCYAMLYYRMVCYFMYFYIFLWRYHMLCVICYALLCLHSFSSNFFFLLAPLFHRLLSPTLSTSLDISTHHHHTLSLHPYSSILYLIYHI
jgi:Vps53-like, N-terminal